MDERFFAEYFAAYAKGYDTFDTEGLAKFYFAPTLMVKNGSVVALETPEEIFEHLRDLLTSYKQHGYQKGNLAGIDVKQLGTWRILVTTSHLGLIIDALALNS
jgi:hypothetical protein